MLFFILINSTNIGLLVNTLNYFSMKDKTVVITGGAGLLGLKHAGAVVDAGGVAVLWDINVEGLTRNQKVLSKQSVTQHVDITDESSICRALEEIITKYGHIDVLINNAANNPKMDNNQSLNWSRLENFPLDIWMNDIAVGLTGAFLCSKVLGSQMAKQESGGVILNIASDLGVIAPDQRLYQKAGLAEHEQPVKPVTYSVVKHGLIGLTKYLSTYWLGKNIRVNSLSPGGVYNNQPEEFVEKICELIPLGRMANVNEYKSAILFLISDASSYMNGSNLIVDGGRCTW
jgi:NAD(P)-dependent dehydrogenase (short-subunit alcohol dehydrogenase family)